jgi:hypothetical protein
VSTLVDVVLVLVFDIHQKQPIQATKTIEHVQHLMARETQHHKTHTIATERERHGLQHEEVKRNSTNRCEAL